MALRAPLIISPSPDDTSSNIEVTLHSADCFRANFLSQAVYYSCHKLFNFLSILHEIYRKFSINHPPLRGGGGLFISSILKGGLIEIGGLIKRRGFLNVAKLTK